VKADIVVRWRMNGSYSLKSVLPVLVPEMTYDGMEIMLLEKMRSMRGR
jgi:hypothetical protein